MGRNNFSGKSVPDDLEGVKSVAGGFYMSAAVLNDGSVVCWGDKDDDFFGVFFDMAEQLTDVKILFSDKHMIAQMVNGDLRIWNTRGEELDKIEGSTDVVVGMGGRGENVTIEELHPVYTLTSLKKASGYRLLMVLFLESGKI